MAGGCVAELAGWDTLQGNSAGHGASWFAVETRPRHERSVASQLHALGFDVFAPTVSKVHRWSDRKKMVQVSLFPRYTFVQMRPSAGERARVLGLFGVHRFVGPRGLGTPIPDKQIADIRAVIETSTPFFMHSFLRVGQRVRVRGGCLEGIEGTLLPGSSDKTLLLFIEPIHQSLAVNIEGYRFEPV
jgi:transcription termination/antitermination protein NusG